MNALDFSMIGLLVFIGGSLVSISIRRMLSEYPLRRLTEAYRSFHSRFSGKIIRKNILRLPGIGLIDPVRPWILGESTALLVLILGIPLDRTIVGMIRLIPVAVLLGTLAAWLAIQGDARKALQSVQRDLPVACFLLSLLLESGMGASSALQEAARSIPSGVLSRELRELVRARSLGMSRGESIEVSRQRIPLEDYRLFLNHIHQGERLGIGLSRSLREISGKMLENQDHRAETIAQQAAVKLLFPLVCFIFPAVFLIILSPVILGLWNRFLG